MFTCDQAGAGTGLHRSSARFHGREDVRIEDIPERPAAAVRPS
jgi:hypothetical protein